MGFEIRRQLREALGPKVKGLQRLVALEIADNVDDVTRTMIKGREFDLDDLARWTGAQDAKAVRDMLTRLAAAGWEFRVPIGRGSDGRPVYAVPGQPLTFRVPEFAISEGPTAVGPSGSKGPTTVVTATTAVGPSGSDTVLSFLSPVPLSLADPLRAAGVAETEMRDLFDWIKGNAPPDKPIKSPRAYLRTVAGNGDLPDLIAEWREATRAQTSAPALPDWCGECNEGRPAARTNPRFRRTADGTLCRCHPDHPDRKTSP